MKILAGKKNCVLVYVTNSHALTGKQIKLWQARLILKDIVP